MKPPLDILPRRDLREAAFRRYEADIARACQGTFELDPQDRTPPLSPSTYCARFRDAQLGYTRYRYTSTIIPPGFPVLNIKAYELPSGLVRLVNESYDLFYNGTAEALRRVNAVCESLASRASTSPYVVAIGFGDTASADFLSSLVKTYDVSVERVNETTFRLT